MRKAWRTAIALVAAVLVVALVRWQGSGTALDLPVAFRASDTVTVVPAPGTPRPGSAAPPASAASAAEPPAPPSAPLSDTTSYGLDDVDKIAAAFDAQSRDPAWAPGTEAALRQDFASVPGLDGAVQVACRTGLCRVTAQVPEGLTLDRADEAVAMLQAKVSAQARADHPFTGSLSAIEQNKETGMARFTVWLTRR